MPTGYTHDVGEGKVTEFDKFALQCARAFGALIMMRDDPMDAEIPEFKPSDWHLQRIAEEADELGRLEAMSASEVVAAANADYEKEVATRWGWQADHDQKRERYAAMLVKARAWQPPTPDHEGLRKFMIEQLETSIDGDCYAVDMPIRQEPAAWHAGKIAKLRRSIEYHRAENVGEIDRANMRNAWVKALRGSLATPGAAP